MKLEKCLIAPSALLLWCVASGCLAQTPAPCRLDTPTTATLEVLFAQAMTAKGEQYAQLRRQVLAQGGAAAFLEAKSKSGDLHSRVLGRVLQSWLLNAEDNLAQTAALVSFIGAGPIKVPPARGEVHMEIAFQMETAWKGLAAGDRPMPDTKLGKVDDWVRVWAPMWLGGWGTRDPDVVPFLADMLKNDPQEGPRTGAAEGLARSKSPDAVEPLIWGMYEADANVRRSCQGGLARLTGQDLGTDPAKYRDWWAANEARMRQEARKEREKWEAEARETLQVLERNRQVPNPPPATKQ